VVMKYPKLRELGEAIRALFTGPYTTKFPKVPHVPAKKFRGKPVPDDEWCVGCTACKEVCPTGAIEVHDDAEKGVRTIIRRYDKCIFCGQCELYCITERGVRLTQEYDLATFDRSTLYVEQQKELLVCDRCGTVIGAKQHILWLIHKLGPLAYSNLPLMLVSQEELKVVEVPREKITMEKPVTRQDMFRILCPKCRHEVLIYDTYARRVETANDK